MFYLNQRAPLYMGMITLSSALVAIMHPGIGILTFVWAMMVFERELRRILRLNSLNESSEDSRHQSSDRTSAGRINLILLTERWQ